MPELALLQQPRGQIAEELAEQLPGLLQLSGSGDEATVVVGDVRKHDKLLEKVRLAPAAHPTPAAFWASRAWLNIANSGPPPAGSAGRARNHAFAHATPMRSSLSSVPRE